MTQEIIEKPMSAECTMKQYEAIPDADFVENREYQLTDYPDNGANAEQMAFALTCQRLFPVDTVVTFSGTTDDNYTNGHLYQIEVDDSGVKSWKDITPVSEQSIPIITGTAEKPINLATDLEVGNYYLLKGYIYFSTSTPSKQIIDTLVYKHKNDRIVFFGTNPAMSASTSSYKFGVQLYLSINSTTGQFITYTVSNTIERLNNVYQESTVSFYAPTVGGAKGQILQSTGDGAPTWVDMPEQSIPVITGTESKPINLATDLEDGKWYLVNGVVTTSSSSTRTYNNCLFAKGTNTVEVYKNNWRGEHIVFDTTTGFATEIRDSVINFSLNNGYQGSFPKIYAPDSAGTKGQILQSAGSGAPEWIDNPAPFILDITDLTTKVSDSNLTLLQNNKVAYIRYTQTDSEQNKTVYLYKKDKTYTEGNTRADGDYMTFSLDWHSSDSISLVSNYLEVYITAPFDQDWENPIEKGQIVQVTQKALLTPSGNPTNGQLPMVQDNKLTWVNTSTMPTKQQTYFVTEKPTITTSPYAEHDLVVVNNQTVYALEKVNNVLTWVKKYITAPFDYVKFETLTNGEGSKEDKIVITDPDASFNIVYEGENSTANIAISKGFTEMAVVDSLGSSRVSLSGNSVNLITQGTEETNKMEMVIATNSSVPFG